MDKFTLPDGLGLRQATASDQPFLASLFHSTREAFYLSGQDKDYIHHLIDQQFDLQTEAYGEQSPDAMTFIVDKSGTPIGRLVLDFGKKIAHIVDLSFIPKARAKGYGKAVIQAVQHIAQKQRLPVGLSVEHQNSRARKLYLSLGFAPYENSISHAFMLWYPVLG
ncbi:GNAT family N-acetyltransferase [Marinimicrobium locisalis]|uniref:GNAT family N-acetyltransferase n=1 Tax=Marinimicrobium locisalis TaxID=546022 RepID=UPI003221D635